MVATDTINILMYLGVALLSARILGEIFERIKLSSILGELLAGMIFGGPLLGMIGANPALFVDNEVLKQFSQQNDQPHPRLQYHQQCGQTCQRQYVRPAQRIPQQYAPCIYVDKYWLLL